MFVPYYAVGAIDWIALAASVHSVCSQNCNLDLPYVRCSSGELWKKLAMGHTYARLFSPLTPSDILASITTQLGDTPVTRRKYSPTPG